MDKLRPVSDADVDVVKQIVNDKDLGAKAMKAMTTMQHQLFGWDNPVEQLGCVGQFAYQYAVKALTSEWAPWRFRYEPHNGQLRVVSKNLFGHRVSFIVSGGHGMENAVKFKNDKGVVTRNAALENRAFSQRFWPTLFDYDPTLRLINPRENLNFGIVYKFDGTLMNAWMFFGVEFTGDKVLGCLDIAHLGQSEFDPDKVPEIGHARNLDAPTDYGFRDELEERNDDDPSDSLQTGT